MDVSSLVVHGKIHRTYLPLLFMERFIYVIYSFAYLSPLKRDVEV